MYNRIFLIVTAMGKSLSLVLIGRSCIQTIKLSYLILTESLARIFDNQAENSQYHPQKLSVFISKLVKVLPTCFICVDFPASQIKTDEEYFVMQIYSSEREISLSSNK